MEHHSDNAKDELVPSEETQDRKQKIDPVWHQNITFVIARSAILTGLCRLVPVPFLDDYLERQSRRAMIHSLLRSDSRTYTSARLAALYQQEKGNFALGCLWWILKLPWTLTVKLLKKLFKKIFFVFAIHEATMSIGETLLLGHSLHRRLLQGAFAEESDDEALVEEARAFKTAFDIAFQGSDNRLLRRLMATVFNQVKALPTAGSRAVRAMFGRGMTQDGEAGEVPEAFKPALMEGIEVLQQAMEKDEVKLFLRDFEARFDQALGQL